MESNEAKTWVVVTGATRGIGEAVVRRCAQDGYAVLAVGRNPDALEQLRVEFGAHIETLLLDLKQEDCGQIVFDTLQKLGVRSSESDASSSILHGIANVAGISQGDSIDAITDEDWQQSFDLNATAPMRLVRSLLPMLKLDGAASIINVSSPVAIVGTRKVSYSASKGAMLGLNVALAENLGEHKIRVNAILPGPTIPGMIDDWDQAKQESVIKNIPLGRLGRPEDVAGVVSFLLSSDSEFMTGSILNVTGGKHMEIG